MFGYSPNFTLTKIEIDMFNDDFFDDDDEDDGEDGDGLSTADRAAQK